MNNKTERISIRLTDQEKLALQEKAKKHKTTLSNYLIASGLNKQICVRYLPDLETEKLKIELAQLGRNLWLLVKLKRVFELSETYNLELLKNEIADLLSKINRKYDH